MIKDPVCSECGGKMEEGYIPDRYLAKIPTIYELPFWVKGWPEINIWGNYKVKGKEKFCVVAYRCENCGSIKLFAKAKMED